jgi:uncharacterized protein
MSKQHSPNRLQPMIDPRKLAVQGVTLDGYIPSKSAERLRDAVLGYENDQIKVTLQFGRDLEKHLTITGHAEAHISVQCQRCLQPMSYLLATDINLAVVRTEESARELPSYLEPLIVSEEKVSTSQIVEEELLLAMPIVMYHPASDCQVDYNVAQNNVSQNRVAQNSEDNENFSAKETEKDNPFSILEKLKGKLSE